MKENPDSGKGEYVILIENEKVKEEEQTLSIESMLVDEIVKNNCTIKEAIDIVNSKNKDISKKEIYNASLNLKKFIK